MGLLRRVLVVPGLAARGDVAGFAAIHDHAGLALGEHLGMLLTAGHVALIGALQWGEQRRIAAVLALAVTALISLGAMEGPALAMGVAGTAFALAAKVGYVALSLWMVASGVSLFRKG